MTFLKKTLYAFFLFTLTHCASTPFDANNPTDVYKNALESVESNRYEQALEKLRKLKHQFPYSKYAALAQFQIAEVYFKQESYQESAIAYQTFIDLHPSHQKVPEAQFQIGESYYQDTPTQIARDLGSAKKALKYFQIFSRRYPHHKRTALAKKRIKTIEERLAKKELYIGAFYERESKNQAAIKRYQKILRYYPHTSSAQEAQKHILSLRRKRHP